MLAVDEARHGGPNLSSRRHRAALADLLALSTAALGAGTAQAGTLGVAAGDDALNAIDGFGANDDLIGADDRDSCQSDAGDRETSCEW
jgi:hypothetical protein